MAKSSPVQIIPDWERESKESPLTRCMQVLYLLTKLNCTTVGKLLAPSLCARQELLCPVTVTATEGGTVKPL